MEWNELSNNFKLSILAGESTVDSSMLVDCEPLVAALKNKASKEDCMEIINQNF